MSEQSDILQVEGINSKGFGIIPKMVMQDDRLSIYAKAIYAYFCSYAGAGKIAFPRVTRIMKDLGISKNAYYRHFNQLRGCGYIKAEQEHINGRLAHNVYTLMETIQCTTKRDTVQCTTKQDTVLQDTVRSDTNINNSIENKQYLKSNSQSVGGTDGRDIPQAIESYSELLKENIGYSDFMETHPLDMNLIDEIISVAVDALVSDSTHVAIEGEMKPRQLVRYQLMKLDYGHIELVIGQFKSLTDRIKKKRQYLLTMLYNVGMELDAHYTNEVKSDFGGIT